MSKEHKKKKKRIHERMHISYTNNELKNNKRKQ